MAEIPSIPQLSAVTLKPITASPTSHNAPQVPPALADLPTGSTLQGFVINRDAQNNPILRTERGDVMVKSELFLKTGADVVIRIENSPQGTRANIVSVDGVPMKDLAQQLAARPQGDTISRSGQWQMSAGLQAATMPNSSAALANNPAFMAKALLITPAATASGTALPGLSPLNLLPAAQQAAAKLPGSQWTLKLIGIQVPESGMAKPAGLPNFKPAAPHALPAQGNHPASPASSPAMPNAASLSQLAAAPLPATPLPANLQPVAPPTAGTPQSVAPVMLTPTSPVTTPQSGQMPAPSPAGAMPDSQTSSVQNASAPMSYQAYRKLESMTGLPPKAMSPAPMANPSASPAYVTPGMIELLHPSEESLASPTLMTGRIVGREANNQSIVQTPIGTFKLAISTPLPTGSQLQFEVANVNAKPTADAPPPTPVALPDMPDKIPSAAAPALGIGSDWQELGALLHTAQSQPGDLAAPLLARLPSIQGNLANAMAMFLGALKGGDMRQWLGARNFDLLEMRMPELARRAAREFASLQPAQADSGQPSVQPWQMVLIPLLHEQELHRVHMYIRQEQPEEQGEASTQDGKRFVIDVQLSQLGDMQFDGFIRLPKGGGTQFDLAVRTLAPLSEEMRNDIRSIFHDTAELTGFKGQLLFQAQPESFVRPLKDNRRANPIAGNGSIIA